jgi:tetratricopeptide (TPR) repeat protein
MHTMESTSGEPVQLGAVIDEFMRGARFFTRDAEIEAVYAIGHAYYVREDYVRAADVFRLLSLCRPEQARGWMALAACHEAANDEDRAEALYEAAVIAPEREADRARARVYLARMLARQRRFSEAREQLERVDLDLVDDELGAEIASVRVMLGGAS